MASEGKKKFDIKKDVNPFGEFKGSEQPLWLYVSPRIAQNFSKMKSVLW